MIIIIIRPMLLLLLLLVLFILSHSRLSWPGRSAPATPPVCQLPVTFYGKPLFA